MNRKYAVVLLALIFSVTFSSTARAGNRWSCWKLADQGVNFYNGGTGDYFNMFQEEAFTDLESWHNYTVMDLVQAGGSGTSDHINAFNGFYGFTEWLGIAIIDGWSGCTIIHGRALANQTYLDDGTYTRDNKKHVICQEVGHLLALDHNRSELTCMNDTILNASHPNPHDQFQLNQIYCPSCPRVALQAANGQWVVAEGGGGGVVNANRDAVGPWETFKLHDLGGGFIASQVANGQYVRADGGGGGGVVDAQGGAIGGWETFFLSFR